MNEPSPFFQLIHQAFLPAPRGVAGLVDDLLGLCQEQELELDWEAGHVAFAPRVGVEPEESIEVQVPKSAFRAVLARFAVLCNERNPGSVSPYGGEGELTVDAGSGTVCQMAFINTLDEQRVRLTRIERLIVRARWNTHNKPAWILIHDSGRLRHAEILARVGRCDAMTRDPETLAHQEWLGYVQPVGLVVSIPALLAAQAHINRNIAPDHQRFLACLPRDKDDEPIPEIRDFAEFTRSVLGWREHDLEPVQAGDERYAALEVTLPEYHETLRPTMPSGNSSRRTQTPLDDARPRAPIGIDLDKVALDRRPALAGHAARQVRAAAARDPGPDRPAGATARRSAWSTPRAARPAAIATFSVAEMAQVAGRPIFAALHMLLCEERLFSLGEKQRLPAILADSRKYQNVVSTKLAEQVLAALFELVRGFQAADDQAKGELLREVLAADPNQVYAGLLTVLMRLVFILYAEDRGLLSSDPVYANYYSVTGLFDRLRADAGRYPDTMDQRYGAWAQLLTLFRLIYEGGSHGGLQIPARKRLSVRSRPLQLPRRPGMEDAAAATTMPRSTCRTSRTASSSACSTTC